MQTCDPQHGQGRWDTCPKTRCRDRVPSSSRSVMYVSDHAVTISISSAIASSLEGTLHAATESMEEELTLLLFGQGCSCNLNRRETACHQHPRQRECQAPLHGASASSGSEGATPTLHLNPAVLGTKTRGASFFAPVPSMIALARSSCSPVVCLSSHQKNHFLQSPLSPYVSWEPVLCIGFQWLRFAFWMSFRAS